MEQFLKQLQPGSVGLDVGCGNGKYLTVNKDVFIIASDRYVGHRGESCFLYQILSFFWGYLFCVYISFFRISLLTWTDSN